MTTMTTNQFDDISSRFVEAMSLIEKASEDKWQALSKEDQLDYFCAVVRRIHRGEVEEDRSYRGVLYDIFGFGPESYAQAQMAGYLDLHNLVFAPDYERKLLIKFAQYLLKEKQLDSVDELVNNFFKEDHHDRYSI